MTYIHLIKKESGFIVGYKKEYSKSTSYTAPAGYEIIDSNAIELKDFLKKEGDYSAENVFVRNADYKQKRQMEYGTTQEQLEYIVENGIDAFVVKQKAIKAKYPKGA